LRQTPRLSRHNRAAISVLARECLDAKGVRREAWEKETEDRVVVLYGL
jgi:hypothetical protein